MADQQPAILRSPHPLLSERLHLPWLVLCEPLIGTGNPFSIALRYLHGLFLHASLALMLTCRTQLDPFVAAQNSQFNIHRPKNSGGPRSRWGGSSSSYGPGGGGGGGGGPGGPGRRIGQVDDVRGPECKSCQ